MSEKLLMLFIAIVCLLGVVATQSTSPKLNESSHNSISDSSTKTLSRRKRYLAFPEGSSFAVSFCGTYGAIGDPHYIYLSWALNWAIAYELPNETWIIEHQKLGHKPKPVTQRRHRRDLYQKLELAIDRMGYDGRQCILRALCESTQYFRNKGSNMVEELIRTIFSLPKSRIFSSEHETLHDYDKARRKGTSNVYCGLEYPGCSFSLIELAFGTYSNPNYI